MIMKKENSVVYVTPESVCIDVVIEGVLCGSPADPGVGGGEDMEEGDNL
jgi:hypothetical protein